VLLARAVDGGFSDLIEKGDRKRAWRVASTIFWLVLLVLGGLTALFILAAPLLLRPFGDPGGDADLAVGLSRVLFPIVVLLGLSGVIVGILNTYDHFTVPALTPVFWNLAIIAGLALGVPRASGEDAQLYVYAGSVLVGTVIQLLLPVPWLRGLDGRLHCLDRREAVLEVRLHGGRLLRLLRHVWTYFLKRMSIMTTKCGRFSRRRPTA